MADKNLHQCVVLILKPRWVAGVGEPGEFVGAACNEQQQACAEGFVREYRIGIVLLIGFEIRKADEMRILRAANRIL